MVLAINYFIKKGSIIDILQGPKYASEAFTLHKNEFFS